MWGTIDNCFANFFKDEVASREKQLKRLSLQALKIVEEFSDNVDVDVSESFQPFFQEWGSVQELAGIPLDEQQKETLEKLRRPASVPPQLSIQDDSEEEFLPDKPNSAPLHRLGIRSFSFGSENSLDVRDRKSSYECSMDTLWSSSSTFSINIENKDDEFDENVGVFIENALRGNQVFVGGSEPNLLDSRSREGTLSDQDYTKVGASKSMDHSLEVEECSKESMETVTGEETSRPDRTEDEIKSLLDDLLERIVDTCKKLSVCAYTPDDSVDEVQRKLREGKVCLSSFLSSNLWLIVKNRKEKNGMAFI